MTGHHGVEQERLLLLDPRFSRAIRLFNTHQWYACHDELESLWHENQGPMRTLLQALLQIAVAELHLERQNRQGAVLLMGEGLGRLGRCGASALGLDLLSLADLVGARLQRLQAGASPEDLPAPVLRSSNVDDQ